MIEGMLVIGALAGIVMAFSLLPAIVVAIVRVALAVGKLIADITLRMFALALVWWLVALTLGDIAATLVLLVAIGFMIHVKVNRIRLFL